MKLFMSHPFMVIVDALQKCNSLQDALDVYLLSHNKITEAAISILEDIKEGKIKPTEIYGKCHEQWKELFGLDEKNLPDQFQKVYQQAEHIKNHIWEELGSKWGWNLVSYKKRFQMALAKQPKTLDSNGNEVYIGLTPEQLISAWFGDHAGDYNKLLKDMREGMSDEDLLAKHQDKKGELTALHIKWAREEEERQQYISEHWPEWARPFVIVEDEVPVKQKRGRKKR